MLSKVIELLLELNRGEDLWVYLRYFEGRILFFCKVTDERGESHQSGGLRPKSDPALLGLNMLTSDPFNKIESINGLTMYIGGYYH